MHQERSDCFAIWCWFGIDSKTAKTARQVNPIEALAGEHFAKANLYNSYIHFMLSMMSIVL